jgi:hypothetical protein
MLCRIPAILTPNTTKNTIMTNRSLYTALALAAGATLGSQAYAGPTAPPSKTVVEAAKESCITGDIGLDVTNAYYYHGIRQEDRGVILQPYADLYFKVYQGSGFLTSLSVDLGIWNSFHDNRRVASTTSNWYEFDFSAGLTWTFNEKWTLGTAFKYYGSPGDYFDNAYALSAKLGYDDKDLLGAFSLQPYVYVEWELDGKSGNGPGEGVYYEAGLTPSYDVGPVTFSLPLRAGFGSNEYYFDNDTYGFFSVGVAASYTLTCIPECLGEWSLTASATYMNLGQGTAVSNDGEEDVWIYAGGLKVAF